MQLYVAIPLAPVVEEELSGEGASAALATTFGLGYLRSPSSASPRSLPERGHTVPIRSRRNVTQALATCEKRVAEVRARTP
jgi:uncharacterized membrane protein